MFIPGSGFDPDASSQFGIGRSTQTTAAAEMVAKRKAAREKREREEKQKTQNQRRVNEIPTFLV